MTEASETTKWSLEADNILCVCAAVCVDACEPSLFLKVFVHVAGRDAALCVCACAVCILCVCVGVGVFLACCVSVCAVHVCAITSET